ncbi:hypothetical protein Lal_00015587 [Lupinus albus]|nr:hypothetical protein Lal_00015587 [Lupinus albus]
MQRDALRWFKWMYHNFQLSDWNSFTRDLETRFGSSSYSITKDERGRRHKQGSLISQGGLPQGRIFDKNKVKISQGGSPQGRILDKNNVKAPQASSHTAGPLKESINSLLGSWELHIHGWTTYGKT